MIITCPCSAVYFRPRKREPTPLRREEMIIAESCGSILIRMEYLRRRGTLETKKFWMLVIRIIRAIALCCPQGTIRLPWCMVNKLEGLPYSFISPPPVPIPDPLPWVWLILRFILICSWLRIRTVFWKEDRSPWWWMEITPFPLPMPPPANLSPFLQLFQWVSQTGLMWEWWWITIPHWLSSIKMEWWFHKITFLKTVLLIFWPRRHGSLEGPVQLKRIILTGAWTT